MDPALALSLRAALALVLGAAAWHKLRDLRAFHAAVSGYALLPAGLVAPAAAALVSAEVTIAAALLAPGSLDAAGRAGAVATAALLTLYTGAIGVNLARGRRDVDCGCAGPGLRQPLHAGLVARNALLVVAALAAAAPVAPRQLGALDAVAIAGAALTLFALHAAAQRLLALHPALARGREE
jgi:hypothetical protein